MHLKPDNQFCIIFFSVDLEEWVVGQIKRAQDSGSHRSLSPSAWNCSCVLQSPKTTSYATQSIVPDVSAPPFLVSMSLPSILIPSDDSSLGSCVEGEKGLQWMRCVQEDGELSQPSCTPWLCWSQDKQKRGKEHCEPHHMVEDIIHPMSPETPSVLGFTQ